MTLQIAHLGPPGTYAEQAAFYYLNWLAKNTGVKATLRPYPTISQSLQAVAMHETELVVVPVENSLEGSVTMTMDALWQLDDLQIQLALVMPINHTLISCATNLNQIQTVYSHPQALAQCQGWLEQFLPTVQLIPSNATTEALQQLNQDTTTAAIASSRAAELYNLPILATNINDHPENSTRFWVISKSQAEHNLVGKRYTSLALSIPANIPGSLVKILQIFAQLNINLSRIESRPTKRSLGEYLFFIDLETDINAPQMQDAISELTTYAEILKIFGSYSVLPIQL